MKDFPPEQNLVVAFDANRHPSTRLLVTVTTVTSGGIGLQINLEISKDGTILRLAMHLNCTRIQSPSFYFPCVLGDFNVNVSFYL